jgi:glycosyltransferase involved in cell wall biosynthesis
MDPQNKISPRISVIVPTFNVAPYIKETIDSLLSQTYTNFEIVVVDDGSSDQTVDIVRSYRDPRIVLIRHETNCGLAAARNTGLRNSRSEFISLLDGDDIAEPTRLAEQLATLELDPDLGMVGSHVAVINEDGQSRGEIWKRPISSDDAAIQLLFRNTFSAVYTVRRTLIPNDGFGHLPMAEDYDFNVRIARCTKVINLDKPLTQVRIRSGGLTLSKKALMEQCILDIMLDQLRELGLSPTPHELAINRHIGILTLDNTPELLDDVETWLMKLIAANHQFGRYELSAFVRVVASEWFEVCKFASPLGVHAWKKYWSSPLGGEAFRPSLIQKIKFAVKCGIRHKRVGGDIPSI